jgi:hypothetical protein
MSGEEGYCGISDNDSWIMCRGLPNAVASVATTAEDIVRGLARENLVPSDATESDSARIPPISTRPTDADVQADAD